VTFADALEFVRSRYADQITAEVLWTAVSDPAEPPPCQSSIPTATAWRHRLVIEMRLCSAMAPASFAGESRQPLGEKRRVVSAIEECLGSASRRRETGMTDSSLRLPVL
jgi:hypothetical protein